jgi:streptomycin 6-kinase
MAQRPEHAAGAAARATQLALPENLAKYAELRDRAGWIATVPAVLEDARIRLKLDWVGEPFQPGGQTAWVAPVRSRTFGDAVLKIAARHEEAIDEAKGLRVWSGAGAVRLFTAEDVNDATTVLLIEHCKPGKWLADEPSSIQDGVIAGLLMKLWVQPPATEGFRPLSEMCDQWAAVSERRAEDLHAYTSVHGNIDAGLVREGIELFRALGRERSPEVLLCTDLHAENVLSSEREPWLMIDPKPYVGDPAYDVLQHIINGAARFGREPRALADRMAALAGVDGERARLWLFARCIVGAVDWPELLSVARQVAPS